MSVLEKKKALGGRITLNIEKFSSAEEVVTKCKERKKTDARFHSRDKGDGITKDFCGVDTYDEALDLLKNGYSETVEDLKKAMKKRAHGEMQKRVSFRNDVVGFMPIIPLALNNVPNNMINSSMKPIKCKVIDVYYDMTASCGVSTKDLIKAGQNVLSAIVDLEKQGYKFNLYAVQNYFSEKDGDMMVVKVKSSDRPLDMKRISFPLTHPAFFRVIGFDWYSKVPDGKYRMGYGHSFSYDYSQKEVDQVAKELFGRNAVFFSAAKIISKGQKEIEEVLENAGKDR